MTTTPPPITKHSEPMLKNWPWTDAEIEWMAKRDAQWMERIAALEAALKKANVQAEHFEREWYLRGDAIEKLEADRKMLREALEQMLEYSGIIEERCDCIATNAARTALENTQMSDPTPDEINELHRKIVYRCRACHAESGLHWYRGTSCPVCSKPECTAFCNAEWTDALAALEDTHD